jgi:hypothetical protein
MARTSLPLLSEPLLTASNFFAEERQLLFISQSLRQRLTFAEHREGCLPLALGEEYPRLTE